MPRLTPLVVLGIALALPLILHAPLAVREVAIDVVGGAGAAVALGVAGAIHAILALPAALATAAGDAARSASAPASGLDSEKIVIITGASSGIGEELAYEAARRRAHGIVLAARREDKLAAVAAKCRALGAGAVGHVVTVRYDASVEADADRLVAAAADAFQQKGGSNRAWVVVLNAGMAGPWAHQRDLAARQLFAEHFFRSNALHCTATARMLIHAECSAVS